MKRAFSRVCRRLLLPTGAVIAALPMAPAGATPDPTGDFLGTYGGPQNGDLDILQVNAGFDGSGYTLAATLGGAPFATSNSLFAWGINRGAGTPRFQVMGSPPAVGSAVLFDALLVLLANGTARTVVFNPGASPTITPLATGWAISGNTITGVAPLALLPSTGFSPQNYTFTLWSRRRINPAMDTDNTEIADFGPTIAATAVPEPASWAMMIAGFGMVGAGARRRRKSPPQQRCNAARV